MKKYFKMEKLTAKEQTIFDNETKIIKKIGSEQAVYNVRCIVSFLKENKLSVGYTKGTTSSLYSNYKIGLSNINPLEYGLISERNYSRKPYPEYVLQPHHKPYFGILLDKKSYLKTKGYIKANKFTKAALEFYNIDITYDKRIDNIRIHKKYSFKELSKLVITKNNFDSSYPINDFNNYIAVRAFNNAKGLNEFWSAEQTNFYHSLANKYSFLQINNVFKVILFQEEWMMLIKKITDLSDFNVNLFRKSLSKKIPLKELDVRLKNKLKEKYKLGKDLKLVNEILRNCIEYLPCKAHYVSDSYIELLTVRRNSLATL